MPTPACTFSEITVYLTAPGTINAHANFLITDGVLDGPNSPLCTLVGSNPASLKRFSFSATTIIWNSITFFPADLAHGGPPNVGWSSNQLIFIPIGIGILTIDDFYHLDGPSVVYFDGNGGGPFTEDPVPPTANSQSVTLPANTTLPIVLTGAVGSGPGPLVYTVTGGPTHGSLSGSTPNVTYTPSPVNYVGADSFTFRTYDLNMDSQADGVVSITVTFDLTSVSPIHGVVEGGTPVTFVGHGFDSGTTFTFDGLLATSVVIVSGIFATGITPAHAAGVVNVVATRSTGEVSTLVNGYTYFRTPNLLSSPPWQTQGQWALHRIDARPRKEGPSGNN